MSNKISETIQKIKALFADVPPAPPVDPAAPPAPVGVDCTLADGRVLNCNPALEVGAVASIDGAPAPEGEYEHADGSKCTVGPDGIISEVKSADAPMPEPEPDFSAQFAELQSDYNSHKQAFSVLQQSFARAEQTLQRQEQVIAQQDKIIKEMFDVVQELAKAPVSAPAEPAKTAFQKQAAQEAEDKIARMAAAWKEMKKA